MATLKKGKKIGPGPYNPQKATAYVGKGVLRNGDTIPAIKGAITPVPNGPLIKKKGPFKGSTLKKGGIVKKAQLGSTVKSAPVAMKNGGKTKSKVNEAGNYTKPGMRKSLFNSIKAGTSGGNAGQWSARKAQLLAKKYKAAGGGYRG